ncbi:MAG: ferrous iron transport protein A [Planctomycetes bacterium]|nr:ferrous iron transport protein A [Planctomycetota bacterium]
MPLPRLPCDSLARIAGLQVDDDDATRLKAMGICVGRQVQLVRAGDPLIVRILGARIGLSARLAEGVSVEPI